MSSDVRAARGGGGARDGECVFFVMVRSRAMGVMRRVRTTARARARERESLSVVMDIPSRARVEEVDARVALERAGKDATLMTFKITRDPDARARAR